MWLGAEAHSPATRHDWREQPSATLRALRAPLHMPFSGTTPCLQLDLCYLQDLVAAAGRPPASGFLRTGRLGRRAAAGVRSAFAANKTALPLQETHGMKGETAAEPGAARPGAAQGWF